jgi:hypothetical protein
MGKDSRRVDLESVDDLDERQARAKAAWSFSFWSAWAIEKSAMALSKTSLPPM